MPTGSYLLIGLFLPLFPLSMGFNFVLGKSRSTLLRIVLLLLWPQIGLILLPMLDSPVPGWIIPLALFTAALYALRALALRDVGQWSGFLATSAWALLWIARQGDMPMLQLHLFALGFSAPLVLLTLLGAGLARRFGAAYTGLYGGLAESLPRFSAILVLVVLAIIATPLFPTFFIMLVTVMQAATFMPLLAVGVTLVWLLWSWAGARLLQGFIVGPAGDEAVIDLNRLATGAYALALTLLVASGLYGLGVLL
ncbi:hypothetical protein [Thiohalophilus thiocyanatoxydans]|uniref:NADH:quinone oxidoreductase/Mrp antiporter membrane subunit domain-containing protein n=1 Tax=Thiohalophilus thiocyanatoxydans TaxID=381308 RepID=A0A4R8IPL3_9GAMM|nr:hypothetical protein [Thiohalophilus thiocyanatoxydans]TDY01120.1 hypothetical protein EDC23_1866 [Thiohalophilus thiocyanatoxydans]